MVAISQDLHGEGTPGVKAHPPEGPNKSWRHFVQFARVITGQLMKEMAAFAGEVQDGSTLVAFV
jgi:hypothetical protein